MGSDDINEQVNTLLLEASPEGRQTAAPEFDILQMPLEGVAAFWLSVKKTLETKKNGETFILDEAKHTREPFIKFLLELASSSFTADKCETLANIRKKNVLADLHRKYILMAIGLLGIVSNENPQKVMVRFLSKFHIAPIFEKQVFDTAQIILKNIDNPELNKKRFLNIDHKMKIAAMIINLVFYCMLARRGGPQLLQNYQEFISSQYYTDGLQLICDGFDYDFVKYRLNLVKKEILDDTERKMDLSIFMMSSIKLGTPFNDLYLIAKTFLP